MKNRLVVAPMTTYSSLPDGNIATDELDYLRRRAAGGFGMVMTAACYVHPSGQAFDGQWACDRDERLPSLRSASEAIQASGSMGVLQIHHGGRQCPPELCGGLPVSASAIPAERPNATTPRALEEAEIEELIGAFADAAARAKRAGFQGIEIHGANTYLLQQFVSPNSNRRDDGWGQDRLAFPLAVTDAVLEAVRPGYPVGYRFSPEETETPGIRWPHTEALIEALCRRPLAWLHVSLNDYRRTSLVGDFDEPVLSKVAAAIKGRLPLMGVGRVRSLDDARAVLAMGCDLVALGRMAITEPEWPLRAKAGDQVRTSVPEEAASVLTLPAGLTRKIYSVVGWFEVEGKWAMQR